MRKPLLHIFILLVLGACARDPYRPDRYLDEETQHKLVRESVYYSMKLPPNADHQTKFDAQFKWYYDRAAKEVELVKYFEGSNGTHYFFMTRVARSITPMREGIGG